MLEARKRVEAGLKEYPMLKRKETIPKYESQHPQHITEHEAIGALALSYSVQEMAESAGCISDRTMRIALQLQDETECLNRDASFEIAQELFDVRRKAKKLEFYISQLPPKQAEVIRKHYFEEYSWPALQEELHVSSRTLIDRRDEDLDELAAIYQYMGQVTQSSKKTPEQNEQISTWTHPVRRRLHNCKRESLL